MKVYTLLILFCATVQCFAQEQEKKQSFMAIYSTGENWQEGKPFPDQQQASGHSTFLSELREKGVITAGFRAGDFGYIFFQSLSREDARAMIDRDPSVAAKTFSVDILPVNVFYKGCLE